eukprot:1799299-Amphidinium_carterae.1
MRPFLERVACEGHEAVQERVERSLKLSMCAGATSQPSSMKLWKRRPHATWATVCACCLAHGGSQ